MSQGLVHRQGMRVRAGGAPGAHCSHRSRAGSLRFSLLAITAMMTITGCAPVLPDAPRRAANDCLPGQVWVCEERHDRPSHESRKKISEFDHCACEDVRF